MMQKQNGYHIVGENIVSGVHRAGVWHTSETDQFIHCVYKDNGSGALMRSDSRKTQSVFVSFALNDLRFFGAPFLKKKKNWDIPIGGHRHLKGHRQDPLWEGVSSEKDLTRVEVWELSPGEDLLLVDSNYGVRLLQHIHDRLELRYPDPLSVPSYLSEVGRVATTIEEVLVFYRLLRQVQAESTHHDLKRYLGPVRWRLWELRQAV